MISYLIEYLVLEIAVEEENALFRYRRRSNSIRKIHPRLILRFGTRTRARGGGFRRGWLPRLPALCRHGPRSLNRRPGGGAGACGCQRRWIARDLRRRHLSVHLARQWLASVVAYPTLLRALLDELGSRFVYLACGYGYLLVTFSRFTLPQIETETVRRKFPPRIGP